MIKRPNEVRIKNLMSSDTNDLSIQTKKVKSENYELIKKYVRIIIFHGLACYPGLCQSSKK